MLGQRPRGRDVGFGCMRLSTDVDRDEARGLATLEAALEAGATILARALRQRGTLAARRIVRAQAACRRSSAASPDRPGT